MGKYQKGEFMLVKLRSLILVSVLLQCLSSNAYSFQTHKILYLISALVINGLSGVNGNIGDICPSKTDVTTMSGTYQLEAALAKNYTYGQEEGNDYLFSDEDCLLPLNHILDFLSLYPGDRIVGLKVQENQVINTKNVQVLQSQAIRSQSSEYWNRAVVVINSSMNLATAQRVMDRSSDYFSEVSRGLLTMDHKIIGVTGSASCNLHENYRNSYSEAKEQGYDLNDFNKVTFVGDFSCNWGGVAYVGGRLSAIQAYGEESALAVEIHESGHLNRGGHASTESVEYGDRNDPLGNGYNHVRFNAPHLEQFGFLRSDEIMAVDYSSYGQYDLRNLDDFDNNQDELQVLRISVPKNPDVFVSFRNAVHSNSYSKQLKKIKVVEIHTHKGKVGEQTILRASLREGDTYCVGQTGTMINVTSIDSDLASIELVEYVPTLAPTSSPQPSFRGSFQPTSAPTQSPVGNTCPRVPNKKIDPLILYPAIGAGALLLTGSFGICLYCACKNKK